MPQLKAKRIPIESLIRNDVGHAEHDEISPLEKFWLKSSVKGGSAFSSISRATGLFERESESILKTLNDCDVDQLSQQVKIPRPGGIRLSSCDWSVFMVVDHLMRFNESALKVIGSLQQGSESFSEQDRFDPDPNVGWECFDDYQEQVWRYAGFLGLQKRMRRGGRAYSSHYPWLGPMTAFQWHYLAAKHTRLHRRQIQKILAVGGVV